LLLFSCADETQTLICRQCFSAVTGRAKAGWTWGCVSGADSCGQAIFVADAHRDDGKHFIVRADEKLTAFVELKSACSRQSFSR